MATSWNLNFPTLIQNTTGTSVLYSGSINQSGFIYMVILPEASGAPSAAQIIAGKDSTNANLASGLYDTEAVVASGSPALLSGYGLTSETDYTAYFIASGYTDGIMADVHDTNFTTADITPPTWSGEYPNFYAIYGLSGTFTLATTENNCSGWVLVVASGAAAPTALAIKSSGTSANMLLAGTVYDVTVTGLIDETAYTAYAVAQDTNATLQPTGYLVYTFMTNDITPPVWTAGYPSVGSITVNSAVLSYKLNDDGDAYFVVVPSGSAAPNYAQVRAGHNAANVSVATGLKGNATLVASTVATNNITNLRYSTYYTVYVVGRDDYENKTNPDVVSASFRTAVPAPGVPGGYYNTKNVTDRKRKIVNSVMNSMK